MPGFLRLREGWLTVGLLALLLFSVTLSIQQAQWVEGLSILTPVTIAALATGIVLAKVRGVPRVLLDLVGLFAGLSVVLVAVASVMTDERYGTIQEKSQDLMLRTGIWVNQAIARQSSDDLLVFILALAVVAWVLAYSSAYFVFKSRQLWWALVPSGVALLINLSYSPVPLNSFIIIFMFSALLLMIRFNLMLEEERWQRERVNYSPSLTWAFLWAGTAVSVVLASVMWFVPTTEVNSTLNQVWSKVNKPWVDFQTGVSHLFPTIQTNQSFGGYSSFNDRFTMGGALNLSDSTALVVKSTERHYWRAKTYDEYNGIGWADTAPGTFNVLPNASSKLSLEASNRLLSEDLARREVTYTVQVKHPKDDILFAVSRPVKLSVASRLNVSWRTINDVYDVQSTQPLSVPLELRVLLGLLKPAQQELSDKDLAGDSGSSLSPLQKLQLTSKGTKIEEQADELKGRGVNVTFDESTRNGYHLFLRASGQVPVYDDITSVHSSSDSVIADEQYSVTSLVTEASEEELRAAGTSYDSWVVKRYTSLPATVPQRVRDLAEKVVADAGATNPYDEGKAIEAYLRNNYKYTTSIGTPPQGVDRADWFLFENKEGYCEYYATAMVVMMRHLGIPTRMATGYAPGSFDGKDTFTVRESSAHTWPEVYFPAYGWIEFEPTPSQAVVNRPALPGEKVDDTPVQPVTSPTPTDGRDANQPNVDDQTLREPISTPRGGVAGSLPGVAAVTLVLAALLFVAFALLAPMSPWRLKRPGAEPAAGHYYGRLVRWAQLLGVGPAPHQTPYEFGDTVSREVPGTALFARTITRAYVQERFSRAGGVSPDRIAVNRAWSSLRGKLWRAMPARQMRRAHRRRKI
ncbi:MAG: DUF3488 and DUF4129 domain-containing transglutaminase family protein [Chloroflexia bacterium]